MNVLILTITVLLFILILWLLNELTQTARHLTNAGYNHDRSDVIQLAMLLLLVIIVAPVLFTLPFFDAYRSESGGTAEIGDTIGGLTSPFINGIGAILVYLAFKEQVKATIQTRNLEIFKMIHDRLSWLKSDPYKIEKLHDRITKHLSQKRVDKQAISMIMYLMVEFSEILVLSNKTSDESESLKQQAEYLYRIIYRDFFDDIQKQTAYFVRNNEDHQDLGIALEYMFEFDKIDKKLGI